VPRQVRCRCRSRVDTEAAVQRRSHERRELRLAHMHHGRVVPAFEIHLGLFLDAVIDNGVETVTLPRPAEWRLGRSL
jgi:hypothetical protein